MYFASGDGPFYFLNVIKNISFLPTTWNATEGFGFGTINRLWSDYPFAFFIKILSEVGMEWWTIDKILWGAMFVLAFMGAYKMGKYFVYSSSGALLSAIIYTSNTYLLLLFGGGQLGVSFGYALIPYVFTRMVQSIDGIVENNQQGIRKALGNGVILALMVFFDLRLALLVLSLVFVYTVWKIIGGSKNRQVKKNLFISGVIVPGFVLVGLNLFWILPVLLFPGSATPSGQEYAGGGMVTYLSVADFAHSLSFLHPNWPENLFGKVYFMQAEFLVFPILSFVSLLFLRGRRVDEREKTILFFVIVGLIGSFLAKGTNEPFGSIYAWLFSNVPGFIMLRDPTKFYVLTTLSYSVLIPYSIEQISIFIENKFRLKKYPSVILFFVFGIFWMFSIRQLLNGELTGNFKPQSIPSEYSRWAELVSRSPDFSRTLWVPTPEKFSYADDVHPAVSIEALFGSNSIEGFLKEIRKPDFIDTLRDASISHVAIPIDIERKIFLDNYVFNGKIRERIIQEMDILGLPTRMIGRLRIYDIPQHKPLVSFQNSKVAYAYDKQSLTYVFQFPEINKDTELVFRMSYDPGWNIHANNKTIKPKIYGKFMVFLIPPMPAGEATLSYIPQYYAKIGMYISLCSFCIIIALYLVFRKKESITHG